MTSACMGGGGMVFMGLFGIAVLMLVALGVAGLLNYLFFTPWL